MEQQKITVWFVQKWEPGIVGLYCEPGEEAWQTISGYYASESSANAFMDAQKSTGKGFRVQSKVIVIQP